MKEIIVDTLGSDNELELLKGAIESAKLFPDFSFKVYTNLEKYGTFAANLPNIAYFDCKKAISNYDNPMTITDENDDCSMSLSLKALHDDENAIGLISGGSTGALLVGTIYNVHTISSLRFPALGALLVTLTGKRVALVDCGANLDAPAVKFVEFAKLGSALMSSLYGIEKPRVGLLNVGKEDKKGNAVSKEAYKLLKDSSLNFVGNIEGKNIYDDSIDVLVTDGFAGNVMLKDSEVVAMICKRIAEKNGANEAAEQINRMFNYNDLGGAIVLGANKIVMKAHGSASAKTISSITEMIKMMDEGKFIQKMNEYLK